MHKSCSLSRRLAAAAFFATTGHALAAPVVNGTTISWPDDGWYQVQNAETYESLCEGGRSCEVPAGLYNVINLTTGERFERIAVTATDVENPGGGDGVYPATIDIETATAPIVSQLAWSFNGEAVSGTSVADVDGDGVRDFVFMTSEADAAPCETQVVVLSSLADSFTLTSDDLADTVQISSTLFAEKNLDGNGCLNIDSIASAHDINGDGLEDLSVFMKPELSPPYYETFYQSSAVIFGRSTGAVVDVAALDGQNGFVITDTESPIAGVGDLNGDGYGDYSFQNSGFFRLSEVHLRAGNATMPARRVSTEILDEPSLAVFGRGTSLTALGDVNGDGLADFASSNYPHGSAIFLGSSNNVIESQPSNLAAVSAIGDHDNDGMDDILVSQATSGCGFQGQVSAIVYGSPDLDPASLDASISAFDKPGQTRVLSSSAIKCGVDDAQTLGDINGDGVDDVRMDSSVLFGTPGRREAIVSMDDLDGSNGFRVKSSYYHAEFDSVDIDADGYSDVVIDQGSVIHGMPTIPLDPDGPQQIVVQVRQGEWTVHWQAPDNEAAAYSLSVNDQELASVTAQSSATINDTNLDAGGILRVTALDSNGNELGSNIRQVPAYEEYGGLSANVYGPKAIELPFNGDSRYVTGLYFLVWRNGELLDTTSPSGVRSYFDSGAQPGQIYHYHIQPDYLLQQTYDEANLTRWPLLQRQSRTVEAWTPLEGIVIPSAGSGVFVTDGNTLYWPDDGRYRVTDAEDGSVLCDGGLACVVPNGSYDVSNQTTGESWSGIVVNKPDDTSVSDGIAPSSPANVTLDIYSVRVAELFWERPAATERVVKTEIYRDGELIGASRGNSYYDGTRESNTAHWYELVAVDADGDRSAIATLNVQRAVQTLQPADPAASQTFSYHTAFDGNTAVIGSEAYRFSAITILEQDADSGRWNVTQQLGGESENNYSDVYGTNFEVSGDTLIATGSDSTDDNPWGRTFIIYTRNDAGVWQETQRISDPASDTDNVSIDGDSMAIRRDTGIEILTRDTSGQWQNSQMLAVDSDGHYPDRPLVLAGDYLAVGRAGHLADGVQTGAVYLYRRSTSGEFALEQQLAPDSSSDIRHAGQSIAFDGRTVVTSAEDGYMIVFARDDAGNWEQNAQLEPIAPNYVSPQLAVDGDRLLAGTSQGSGLINYSGVVVVFERQASGNWMETTRLVPDSGASSFGSSVNLHGNKALIGAGSSTIDNSSDYAKVASGHYYEFE